MKKVYNSVNTSKPIFKKAMSTAAYIDLHRATLNLRNLHRIRHNEVNMAINLLEEFLPSHSQINPDEAMMAEFTKFLMLKHGHEKARYCEKFLSVIRTNNNLIPETQRPLLTPRQHIKLTRFENYTPQTQKLFQEFIRDGRKVKGNNSQDSVILTQQLAAATRNATVANAVLLLNTLGMPDILRIGNKQVEQFIQAYDKMGKKRDTSLHLLADLNPLFRYMCGKGLIKENPVAHITKPKKVNSDYVEQDDIDKLLNLRTLNFDDIYEVRDRFIAVCLDYDFAFRNSESSSLDVTDLRFKKYLEINLRSEIQAKQQNHKGAKRDILFRNFFDESRILAERYLELRAKRKPDTPALLLSEKDARLGASGCCNAVQRTCNKLKIRTLKGEVPSPHRLRHSMATLNVRPLGIKLELRQIQKRMRHKSIRTTEDVYVANNPLIDAAEHDAWAEEYNGNNGNNGNGNTIIHPQPKQIQAEDLAFITEADAMRRLHPFNIKPVSLRKYASEQGEVQTNGGQYSYSDSFIHDLTTNYFTKTEAMRMLGYKASGFHYWVTSNCITQVFIGKVMLIRKDDVMGKVRGE